MHDDEREDSTTYKVVINHEEQYSLWPTDRENPLGWRDSGFSGSRADCLAHIETVWTDMRPLSLRRYMAETHPTAVTPQADDGRDLVSYLAAGLHPVTASPRPEPTVEALRQSIDRGYVQLTFTDTQGGTELGLKLDREASDLAQADFERRTGTARLVGGVVLDDVTIRCHAEIALETLAGQGRIEVVH